MFIFFKSLSQSINISLIIKTMKYLLKHTLKLFFLTIVLIFLYQIGQPSYLHFASHSNQPLIQNLKEIAKISNQTLNSSIQLIKEAQYGEFRLVKKFLWLYHNKIYWIVFSLLVLICYYQYRSRGIKTPLKTSSQIPAYKYEEEKRKLTKSQVGKLIISQKYKDYERKKNEKQVSPDVIEVEKEEDEDFIKDLKENQAKIFHN